MRQLFKSVQLQWFGYVGIFSGVFLQYSLNILYAAHPSGKELIESIF